MNKKKIGGWVHLESEFNVMIKKSSRGLMETCMEFQPFWINSVLSQYTVDEILFVVNELWSEVDELWFVVDETRTNWVFVGLETCSSSFLFPLSFCTPPSTT